MNFGMSTNCFRGCSAQDLARICQGAGIPSLEIWDDDGYFVETTLSSEELARIFRDAGLSISSVHTPFSNWSELALDTYFDRFKQSCEKACVFNARYIVIHPIAFSSERKLDRVSVHTSMPRSLEVWRGLAEIALEFGLEAAFENLPRGALWPSGCSLETVAEIVQGIDLENVGVCVDFSHCFALGDDIVAGLRKHNFLRIIGVHASDGIYADLADQHLIPGEGELDWVDAFRALRENGFTGDIVLEAKGLSDKPTELQGVFRFIIDARNSST